LVGNALSALAGWLIENFWNVLFPNCDGPVAAGIHSFTGAELRAWFATNNLMLFMTKTDPNPGITSQNGCGNNSNYDVTWMIERPNA